MILDTISKLDNYISCHSQFTDVISFLQNTNIQELSNGKHSINNKGAFVSVNEYETKVESDCFIECHRAFIDVQIISKGEEIMGYCPISCCIKQPYDSIKDLQKLEGILSYFNFTTEMFVVFFPQDAHMPCLRKGGEVSLVKKIVFKIPVE